MSDSTGVNADVPRGTKPLNIVLVIAIIGAIVGATWWLGERNGWADIGTGGSNQKLLPRVGEEAPEFFTLREDMQPVLLSQLRGQPVWINFWGSWCYPCRSEMPEFMTAYDKLTEQGGITILAVSINEAPEQAMQYRDLVGGTFPVYMDPAYISQVVDAEQDPELAAQFESMRSDWQIRNFPTHVFIDADGIVREIVLAQMTDDAMIESAQAVMGSAMLLPDVVVTRFE